MSLQCSCAYDHKQFEQNRVPIRARRSYADRQTLTAHHQASRLLRAIRQLHYTRNQPTMLLAMSCGSLSVMHMALYESITIDMNDLHTVVFGNLKTGLVIIQGNLNVQVFHTMLITTPVHAQIFVTY